MFKMKRGVFVVNQLKTTDKKMEVDLEEALDMVGFGRYQVLHSILMTFILTSALLEMVGCSFIMPAADCDLHLSSSVRGFISSVPNIGIILTAGIWGKASDTLGRRPTLVVSTAAAGVLGMTASIMPEAILFALCKFAASLFLSSPSSLCYAFIGEIVPRKRRDGTLMILNAMFMYGTVFVPLLAWGVLSNEWRFELGPLTVRSWRVLTFVYAAPLLVSSILLLFTADSPKYLLARGKHEEALEVLRRMYAFNTGLPKENYAVASLKPVETDVCYDTEDKPHDKPNFNLATLFKPPHLKWLALTGFLMFGLFSSLNGLFLFAPDIINRVLSRDSICSLVPQDDDAQIGNSTTCMDSLTEATFQFASVLTVIGSTVVFVASLCPIDKRTTVAVTFAVTGVACLVAVLSRHRYVVVAAIATLQLTTLSLGPLTAYTVQLFPTSLRGSAMGVVMMFGRLGSVVGANAAGVMLQAACGATFYVFASILFVCGALSYFLPKGQTRASNAVNVADGDR